ncbi:MAG: aldehyde reductase, partial [Chloroflexota bacterium]
MSGELVLVTGGTGFVGIHCILQLLNAGYRVRTTVRSLKREADVRAMLRVGSVEPGDLLSFAAADLTSDVGWSEAVEGCDFVLHVASPFPPTSPKDENELIIPAREGALRVLRAARDAGVKRVVLTSSFAAIGYGHKPTDQPFTEETWTDVNGPGVSAYAKSKTLAEHAAWDFIEHEGGTLELAVVNPVGIFGPVLGADYSSSIRVLQQLVTGEMARLPSLSFGIVDVRDVADMHLMAMINPAAKGQRFLATAGLMSIREGAQVLKSRMGEAGNRISTKPMPDWLVRLAAPFSPAAAQIVHDLGKVRRASNEKAKRVLGWS